MKNILGRTKELVDKLQSNSSSNNKINLIKEYFHDSELKELFMYVYNPFYQFHVTSDNCKKLSHISSVTECDDIFCLLNQLRNRDVTGHEAIGRVNSFILANIEYKELIYDIIDKDLKCRIGESIINKAVPGTIPTFDVALAEKFEPEMVDFEKEDWFVSRKLDGVRCIVVIDENGKVTSFSRQGKIFDTLGKVEDAISQLNFSNIVFDGEICMVDEYVEIEFEDGSVERYKNTDLVETTNGIKLVSDLTDDDDIISNYNESY